MMRLPILVSFSGDGGVERMMLNLTDVWSRWGIPIDLLVIKTRSRHLHTLPATVAVKPLGEHAVTAWPNMVRYLIENRPPVMLVAKDRAGRMALLARSLAGVPTRIVIRIGTHLSAALADQPWITRQWRLHPMRWFYRQADQVIAVSRGVADDFQSVTGIGSERVMVIPNPVITPRLFDLAAAFPQHPWLKDTLPIILGVGRLTPQKDFATLIRAFAQVRLQKSCRLMVLGEGRLRSELQALVVQLGISNAVDFVGFVDNPYSYMKYAAVFVLASRWEGSPNVLTEAMALGTSVVATDCPSGPREILHAGTIAPLVPVGDVAALAHAILTLLTQPIAPATLQAAVREYQAELSARRYLQALEYPAAAH